ncbi:ATP-binding cassette domain-containing protein [Enterococcus cecorum]
MIEINKVVKSFHHKEVLNIEQLTIHKGETVAVMGMNGAGKSTLIKLISGLFNQDQWHDFRRWSGKYRPSYPPKSQIRLRKRTWLL